MSYQVRDIGEFDAVPVPDTVGNMSNAPGCLSPDGSWLAYVTVDGALRKAPVAGGRGLTLVDDTPVGNPCDWADDGYIYFPSENRIVRVSDAGGDVETVLEPDTAAGVASVLFPQLLPDGKSLLYSMLSVGGLGAGIYVGVADLESGERTTLLTDAGIGSFVPSGSTPGLGHLVYGSDAALFAAPFDVATRRVGRVSPVLDDLLGAGPLTFAGVSDTGTLVYFSGEAAVVAATRMVVADRGGTQTAVPEEPLLYGEIALSPDQRRAATSVLDLAVLRSDIWVYEFDGARFKNLTFDRQNYNVVWMPDGESLIFASTGSIADEDPELRVVPIDGSRPPATLLPVTGQPLRPTSVHPDGTALIGTRLLTGDQSSGDIWLLPLPADLAAATELDAAEPTFLFDSGFNEHHAVFSPDGNFIAFVSDESGRDEIYVVPYPGPGGKVQVSVNGGREPRWNPAGGELFFLTPQAVMVVDIETSGGFERGTPRVLFAGDGLTGEFNSISSSSHYGVAPDGSSFLFLDEASSSGATSLRVVENWFEELRELSPFPDGWE